MVAKKHGKMRMTCPCFLSARITILGGEFDAHDNSGLGDLGVLGGFSL
jgi:hypothetical protein